MSRTKLTYLITCILLLSTDLLYARIYEALKLLPHFDVVSAKGFTPLADGVHLNASSQRTSGERYAVKMKVLR